MDWSWNERQSDTWSHGTFKTREEAIEEAISSGYRDFYIGECETFHPRVDADPDRIMEELDELYSNDSGCDDYIYENVTDEDRKWLACKLEELMTEFNQRAKIEPEWFRVIGEEHIILD
jgi:hypothetical protein